jgi:hypothetical protein
MLHVYSNFYLQLDAEIEEECNLFKRFNKTKEYSFHSLLSWAANAVGTLSGNVLRALATATKETIVSPVGGVVACGAAVGGVAAGLCQAGLLVLAPEFFAVGIGFVIAVFVVGMVSNLFSCKKVVDYDIVGAA